MRLIRTNIIRRTFTASQSPSSRTRSWSTSVEIAKVMDIDLSKFKK